MNRVDQKKTARSTHKARSPARQRHLQQVLEKSPTDRTYPVCKMPTVATLAMCWDDLK